jgi:hypothetical protein
MKKGVVFMLQRVILFIAGTVFLYFASVFVLFVVPLIYGKFGITIKLRVDNIWRAGIYATILTIGIRDYVKLFSYRNGLYLSLKLCKAAQYRNIFSTKLSFLNLHSSFTIRYLSVLPTVCSARTLPEEISRLVSFCFTVNSFRAAFFAAE